MLSAIGPTSTRSARDDVDDDNTVAVVLEEGKMDDLAVSRSTELFAGGEESSSDWRGVDIDG